MSDAPGGDASAALALELVEQERAQIAHEIHDALLPLLFAASSVLDRLNKDLASRPPGSTDDQVNAQAEQLARVSDWLSEAMTTGRELLQRTYPAELEQSHWHNALIDVAERLFPDLDLQWNLDPSTRKLPIEVASVAYRIGLEAIRNAVRHGRASEVQVAAEFRQPGFQLSIRDNGSGFDPAEVPRDRFGIRSMRGRARLVGGTLDVRSSVGGPTVVCFRWNVDDEAGTVDA